MRTFIGFPNYDFRTSWWAPTQENMRTYLLTVRDRMRQKLDGDSTHQYWMVGDIAFWTGGSTFNGYGFAVYHMDGSEVDPEPTGPAWAFFFPGEYSSGLVDVDDFLQNAQISNYARDSTSASTTITTNGPPLFHYCETGGTTTPYAFGYDVNAELSGGDFTGPTISPWTNFAGFMPGTTFLYGVIPQYMVDNLQTKWAMIWDHDLPAMMFYNAWGNLPIPHNVVAMGEIIEPFVTADTRRSGVARWSMSAATAASGDTIAYQSCWAYNAAGTRTEYTISAHGKYDARFGSGDFLLDGEWVWDPVMVSSSAHLKGWFDTRVVRETIPYAPGFVVGDFYKASATLMFMYDASFPVPPQDEENTI